MERTELILSRNELNTKLKQFSNYGRFNDRENFMYEMIMQFCHDIKVNTKEGMIETPTLRYLCDQLSTDVIDLRQVA